MNIPISVDGDWWAFALLAAVFAIGIAAWRTGKSPARAADTGTTATTPDPASAPAPPPKEPREPGKPWLGPALGWSIKVLAGVLAAILLVVLVVWFFSGGANQLVVLSAESMSRLLFGSGKPPVTRQVVVSPGPTASPDPGEQARIEGGRHSVAFTYELPPDWIKNPPGYHSNFESLDGKKIDIQCVASPFKPERHVSREAYPCDPGAPTYWWRPVASTPDEGIINVRWQFEKDS